eukprot:7253908-Prymnesium_polylepis.2
MKAEGRAPRGEQRDGRNRKGGREDEAGTPPGAVRPSSRTRPSRAELPASRALPRHRCSFASSVHLSSFDWSRSITSRISATDACRYEPLLIFDSPRCQNRTSSAAGTSRAASPVRPLESGSGAVAFVAGCQRARAALRAMR